MKRFFTLLAFALALCSCEGDKFKDDPVAAVLRQRMLAGMEGMHPELVLKELTLIDSTSYLSEFERRDEVFSLKIERETDLYFKYWNSGREQSAKVKKAAIIQDSTRLKKLRELRKQMEADGTISNTAYYDYLFRGYIYADRQKIDYDSCWFNITPDGRIISVTRQRKDLHKATGLSIPGYKEILVGEDQ